MIKNVLVFLFLVSSLSAFSQTEQQRKTLKEFSEFLKKEQEISYQKAVALSGVKGWPLEVKLAFGGVMKLVGIYPNGMPEYIGTESNVGAANTTGASLLWNGGASNLNLTGSSAIMAGKLAIWDGGSLLSNHQELTGRVLAGDGASSLSDHATHVAGTMIAKGINPIAKGMAYNIPNITSYDFSGDNAEIAGGANNFLLSNHSYGAIAGWRANGAVWEFWGEFNASEDYKFGYYDSKSRYWDSISVLSPNYLIVKSAGNKRNENGPSIGQNHSRFNAAGQMQPAGVYNGGISRNDSYDILPTNACAKNILTVGAAEILNNGYAGIASVQISDFSSYGPTDDGRIKPDIVAAGVNLFSTISTGVNAYDTYSGTSMSSPNATGSLLLLQELYQRETSSFMRSATLKGIAIHTADESGANPGPDYIHGWGLLDVNMGAQVIMGRNTTHRILQNNLTQGSTFSLNTISSGGEKLVATIVWTDPAASVENVNYLNNRAPKLINDLDLRIVSSSGTVLPWKLDVNNPSAAATRGDNVLDNVEKVEIINPIPGETYEIRVTHKGTLVNTSQNYSLIISGVGGTAYCTSQPNSNSNSRINNFAYAGINRNGSGCTQYTNATSTFATVFPTQVASFSLTLGTCGADIDKMAKIFIDWNGDGDFVDANELCATSGVIAGTGVFSGNITTPANVLIGSSSRIRIVASETTDPATIQPCGNYAFGETQDFSIRFGQALRDGRVVNVFLPESGICANSNTFIAATIQNNGTSVLSNVPVRALVLDGATTVATLLDTLFRFVQPSAYGTVYFRNTFNAVAGKTYTIRVNTDLQTEQFRNNDTLTVTKVIANASTATITNATAQLCSPTQASLACTSPNNSTVYWYTSATSNIPIGSGNTFTTSTVPSNNTYFAGINDAKGNVGPANKNSLGTSGGYATFSNVQNLTVYTPIEIESSRMYFGSEGTVTVVVKETGSGNIVAQTSLEVLPTTSTPGSGNNDLNDTGRVMPLNLKIPTPGNYTIGVTTSGGATVFRNNSIATNPYPFTLNSLMDIVNSNNGTGLTTYYWFYDLRVRALGCAASGVRTSVVAAPVISPAISQNGAILTSSATGSNYQWTLNGNPVPNSNSNSITITSSGNYVVSINQGGCTFSSPAFSAVFTNIQNVNPSEISLIVTPIPANERAEVRFITPKRENVVMDLLHVSGAKIHTERFVALANTLVSKSINVRSLASGTYILRLYFDGKQVMKKLIVSK